MRRRTIDVRDFPLSQLGLGPIEPRWVLQRLPISILELQNLECIFGPLILPRGQWVSTRSGGRGPSQVREEIKIFPKVGLDFVEKSGRSLVMKSL